MESGAVMKNSPLLPIFLIVAVDVLGITIILPLLPFYSESLGASPFVIGTIVSVYGLCQFIAGPILGKASDRFGRKPILMISQLGTFAGFILLALSRSLVLVFLARIIDGLTAGNISVAQAYISDNTEPKDRTRAFGIVGASFGLGFLIGPAISGVLSKYGNQTPIWAAAGLSALSILATLTLLPNGVKPPQGARRNKGFLPFKDIKEFSRDPVVAQLLMQFMAFSFAFSMFVSGLALFCAARFHWRGHSFGAAEVGYVFTYSGAINLTVQLFLMKVLAKKWGDAKIVMIGFLLMAIGYGALSGVSSVSLLLFYLTFNNLGAAVLRPALTSQISQNVGREHQGTVLGVNQSLQSIAVIIAPLFSGLFIDRGYLGLWALACSGVAAIGFGLALARPARASGAAV
jgi:DHA1 family tetracycline resistance protein-like MFS transporter